eukprot:Phypoly_transcript_17341.p1 GENE.Phypoly_transcript_17341~~Phypoly_transcript_17341.p1  ORF type:complete len:113 (-),score=7.74 Phypoly_transcript_17341:111-449(-)
MRDWGIGLLQEGKHQIPQPNRRVLRKVHSPGHEHSLLYVALCDKNVKQLERLGIFQVVSGNAFLPSPHNVLLGHIGALAVLGQLFSLALPYFSDKIQAFRLEKEYNKKGEKY